MAEIKTVLITGVGGGIGRACAQHFFNKGGRVIGVDRLDCSEDFPSNGHFIKADISHPESAEMIFQEAKNFHPSLDVLVNNAALQIAKPLVETTVEEWDAVMASNLRSVFLFVKLAYPLMKAAGGGAIGNVSSVLWIKIKRSYASPASLRAGRRRRRRSRPPDRPILRMTRSNEETYGRVVSAAETARARVGRAPRA